MQFVIKSEILDGRLPCKWERKELKMHHSLLAVPGWGICWSKCSWSGVNPTLPCPEPLNIRTRQAKYIVRSVSWCTWTALASAWWSLPLLCPEVWLPSALKDKGRGKTKNNRLWGGRETLFNLPLLAYVSVSFVSSEQNGQTLFTLKATSEVLKHKTAQTGTSALFQQHNSVVRANSTSNCWGHHWSQN